MSPTSAEVRRARAAAEAAEWATRFDSGDLALSARTEFMEWLRESPMHVSEMLRIGRLTGGLSRFNHWDRIAPAGDVSLETVTRLSDRRAIPLAERSARTWVRWIAAIAATLACVVVSAMLLKQQLSTTAIHTQPGERREVTLADGSIIQLAPNTDLRVRLQPHIRSMVIERGEASFRVSKDPMRPFVVDAAKAQIRAVGTIFSVVCNAEAVVVTVTEGRVSVTPAADRAATPLDGTVATGVALTANERIIVSARGIPSPIRHLDSVPMLAWGDNRLIFEARSVADVANQFNRRNALQIRLTDNALASRTISATLDVNDPQSFVDFLQSVAGTTSKRNGDEIIVTPDGRGAHRVGPVISSIKRFKKNPAHGESNPGPNAVLHL
jgi:transmembrane sensor